MKRLLALLLAPLCLLAAAGCAPAPAPVVSCSGFALDTAVSVSLYGDYDRSIAQGAVELCQSYEAVLSRTDPDSELYRLNAGELTEVSDDLARVLALALSYARLSQGAFDPTLGRLSDLWRFTDPDPRVPGAGEIAGALAGSGWQGVWLEGNRVALPEGCHVDLGGVAKGYIADRLRAYLAAQGVTSALIDLGGNLSCLGTKPGGDPFRVGVQYPSRDSSQIIAALSAQDVSVVTSGVYQRCFQQDGVLYHHILDSATGCPARSGLLSVTVVAPTSAAADALSTACFVLGLEEGMALVDALEDTYALFITEDLALHPSAGLEETFDLAPL